MEKMNIENKAKRKTKRRRWFFVLAALATWGLLAFFCSEKRGEMLYPPILVVLGLVGWIFLVAAAEVSEIKIKTKLQQKEIKGR